MPNGGHNALEGMGELLLSLVWKNCTSLQWASWLQLTLKGAATGSDTDMVLALLNAGASSIGIRSGDDLTPLHSAALGGSLDVVSSLLKTNAIHDVNKKTLATKRTPLHIAVDSGHADVALALARAGGDLNLADSRGWSPLMRAANDGRAELVTNLLLRGSQVDAKGQNGNQALHYAARQGHLGVVRVLLQGRACPGTRNKDEISPVDCAVRGENTDALFELLSSARNLNILDDGGKSAMLIAVETGKPKAIGMLADAGMDLDSPIDDDGSMPLHIACYYSHPSSVQELLRRNADETVRNDDNELPEEVVGHSAFEGEENNAVVEDIRKMLARAPADRVWCRRGWLAMLKARKRATDKKLTLDQQHLRKDNGDGAGNDQRHQAEPPSVLSSRRKLADGGKWATDGVVHVHPTHKKFHWAVTKMVDVADELVFRNIVSYL